MSEIIMCIVLVFNSTGSTTRIYIHEDYVLSIYEWTTQINEESPALYAFYDLKSQKHYTTTSKDSTCSLFPLTVVTADGWSADGVYQVGEEVIEEQVNFKGFKCVRVKEVISFPPLPPLEMERREKSFFHLVCTAEALAEKIKNPAVIPYLPISRKKLNGKYEDYTIVLHTFAEDFDEEYGYSKSTLTEFMKTEEVPMPMKIIEQVLAKSIKNP
jgi:hypothetical protein